MFKYNIEDLENVLAGVHDVLDDFLTRLGKESESKGILNGALKKPKIRKGSKAADDALVKALEPQATVKFKNNPVELFARLMEKEHVGKGTKLTKAIWEEAKRRLG